MTRLIQFKWSYLKKTLTFLNDIQGLPGQFSEQDFIDWVSIPSNNPLKNILLLENFKNGKLEAVIFVWAELNIRRIVVEVKIPTNNISKFNIKNILKLEAIFSDIYSKSDYIHVPLDENANLLFDEFEKIGFNHIRTYVEMELSDVSFINSTIIDGYLFKNYIHGDEKKLTFVQNESFKDSWGFSPNSVEQIYYKVNSNIYSGKGVIFLVKDNTIIGYAWTYLRQTKSGVIGVIVKIGVLPEYRKNQFGKIIAEKAINELLDQGVKNIHLEVDLANLQAVRLYSKLGFKEVRKIYWYEKLLT